MLTILPPKTTNATVGQTSVNSVSCNKSDTQQKLIARRKSAQSENMDLTVKKPQPKQEMAQMKLMLEQMRTPKCSLIKKQASNMSKSYNKMN